MLIGVKHNSEDLILLTQLSKGSDRLKEFCFKIFESLVGFCFGQWPRIADSRQNQEPPKLSLDLCREQPTDETFRREA